LIGIYFSGTGNTRHCVEEFVRCYDDGSAAVSIETPDIIEIIADHDFIVFGYPVYFSNMPKIVRDFIVAHRSCFQDKKIFIIATMGLFSGDGAGCSARLFKKYGANIVGGLHLLMPDCIGDEKLLKRGPAKTKAIIEQGDAKIRFAVQRLKEGKPTKEGLNIFYHLAGLFGQRLWFYRKTATYKDKPHIDRDKCIGCGRCAQLCPLKNIEIREAKAASKGKCTMCYRCFSHCPAQALTILGKHVYEQYRFEEFKGVLR